MPEETYTRPVPLAAIRISVELLVAECHGAAWNAGWWIDRRSNTNHVALIRKGRGDFAQTDWNGPRLAKALVAEKLCLVHSEISGAMEGHRKGAADKHLPHRPSIEVKLADAVMRICDLAGALGLDLGGAIGEKMAFNAQRADHKADARDAPGGKAY